MDRRGIVVALTAALLTVGGASEASAASPSPVATQAGCFGQAVSALAQSAARESGGIGQTVKRAAALGETVFGCGPGGK